MANYEEQSYSIQEVIEHMKYETPINDEEVIKKEMYNCLLPSQKDNISLDEYINLQNNEDAMFGSIRGYVTFVQTPLKNALNQISSLEE